MIEEPAKGNSRFDPVQSRLSDIATGQRWDRTEGTWIRWKYLILRPDETDLDAFAVGHVEELVTAWDMMQSAIDGMSPA